MFGLFGDKGLKTLTPAEVKDLLDRGAIHLVDVREGNEWAAGHIPGALHAPLSQLESSVATLPQDKPVIFHCAAGARSAKAVALARQLGHPHDSHMGGGIGAWMAHGFPVKR